MKPTYEQLEQRLAESQREFRSADATIQNLQMQVERLAAESQGLKNLARGWANATDDRLFEEHGEIFHDSIEACEEELKTICPATDDVLAEVRASAVESLVDIKTKQLADMHPDTHAFGATAMSIRSQINELQVFADQLRQGGAA